MDERYGATVRRAAGTSDGDARSGGNARGGAIDAVLRQIDRDPLPSREEELELVHRVGAARARLRTARTPDEAASAEALHREARNELAARNLRLVVSCARRFQGLGVPSPDLIQEGTLGLLRAIDRFEPERGHRLSTYAVWWIRQSLVKAVQSQSRTVRLPGHVNEHLTRFRRAAARLTAQTGRPPLDEEVMDALGSKFPSAATLRAFRQRSVSIHAPLSPDDDESPTLEERLADPAQRDPQAVLERAERAEEALALVERLPSQERRVIQASFGIPSDSPRTQSELAQELGVPRRRVQVLQQRALDRLRAWTGGTLYRRREAR